MDFDWHDAKNASNLAKHGIDFVDITECFELNDTLIWQDTRRNYGERRMNMIAPWKGKFVHITFTMRGETCWIISARTASQKERKRYE